MTAGHRHGMGSYLRLSREHYWRQGLETGHGIFLWWNNHHVRRDAVSGHAVLALLHRTVEAELVLLGDAVEHDLVGHRRLDRATRAESLGEVVAWLGQSVRERPRGSQRWRCTGVVCGVRKS